ncbi:VanW family protein [Patescibacteria group bacterium]|nr:VanW family protein [Patescibacteria group bacterium]
MIQISKDKLNNLIHSRNTLICIVIILIIIIFFFTLNTLNINKLNIGMRIAGISVSGLYINEAREAIQENCEEFLKKEISLNYKDSFWKTDLRNLGVEINIEQTLENALNKGHNKSLFKNIYWQAKSLFGYNINPEYKINEEKLNNFLENNLASIHNPAKNASLIYENNEFKTTPSKEGVIIDKKELKKNIEKNINNLEQNNIKLSLIKDKPEVLENETDQAKQKANEILEKAPIDLLILNEKISTIDKEILLSLIIFEPNNGILDAKLDQEKIKNYLITLSPLINKEPIDAKLTIRDGKVVEFALSQKGIILDLKDNIEIISKLEKQIELKINEAKPKITTDSINNLGITSLLAIGKSNFAGSPESRIHNIRIGTAKFDGYLIKPDEEFSFNEILGEVGEEQGYKAELVIKKDKTIPEYGGGLCQVSTTMFRAAVNAGLEITRRYPHSFAVKYYNPQGFDATIYPPFPDLRFINNTPNHILIQVKIEEYKLMFEFYGTSDNRIVQIDGPYQYDIKEDGSMKATLTQKVYDKNNNIIIDKIFNSTYKSPDLYPIEKNPLE